MSGGPNPPPPNPENLADSVALLKQVKKSCKKAGLGAEVIILDSVIEYIKRYMREDKD